MLLGVAGCSGIRTDAFTDETIDLSAYRTYAWSTGATPAGLAGDPVGDPELGRTVRRAIDQQLAALRLTEVAVADADLLVGHAVTVEERLQTNDPYYAVYPLEKYELGTMAVDLVDRATGKLVWRGVARDRLRYTARAVGVSARRYVSTDAPREWHVEDMVGAIFARFPTR
ncbi:MAG: DUF4136 domain-containing protein [Planctomycetes bacterium]|nr:DUF4136 domain-containing protein [Planctomycetota bacterium]